MEGRATCRRMTQARGAAISEALCAWSERDLSNFVELFRDFNACVEAYQHGRSTGHDPSAADAAAVARQESLRARQHRRRPNGAPALRSRWAMV
jgi:hypothetical protein